MSEDQIKSGHHGDAEFEQQDISPMPVFGFLLGLAVACLLVYVALRGMYAMLDSHERSHQPPQSPLVEQTTKDTRIVAPTDITKFPAPRLESNERLEIKDFRMQEEQALNSYSWVDQQAGVVHIPIERAMELVAQRGLPVLPPSGTKH